MEERDRATLRKNRTYLEENILDASHLMSYLYQEAVLTANMKDEIEAEIIPLKKKQKLLDFLPFRGAEAMYHFLESCSRGGHQEVRDYIEANLATEADVRRYRESDAMLETGLHQGPAFPGYHADENDGGELVPYIPLTVAPAIGDEVSLAHPTSQLQGIPYNIADRRVTERELALLGMTLGSDTWIFLARLLGFTEARISHFADYAPRSVPTQASRMLVAWLHWRDSNATIGNLVHQLTIAQVPYSHYRHVFT